MLEIKDLVHVYGDGHTAVTALEVPYFAASDGEMWCITGPSGSGKSTLLHCISGLLRPTRGTLTWDGRPIGGPGQGTLAELDAWRARSVGYVFQKFNLLPFLTARDNILTGAHFGGVGPAEARRRTEELADRMGLGHLLDQYPQAMSQGEQQRVAIARALVKNPPVRLAVAPTSHPGAADSRAVIDLLQAYGARHAALILIASHDPMVIDAFPHRLPLSKAHGGERRPA